MTLRSTTLASLLLSGAALAQDAAAPARSGPELVEVARFEHQVTGVAVSEDRRLFVSFPRWTEDVPMSVAEVVDG